MKIDDGFIRKTFYIKEDTLNELANLKNQTGNTYTLIVNNAIQAYEMLINTQEISIHSKNDSNDLLVLKKQAKFLDEHKRTTFYIKEENWETIKCIAEERDDTITAVINDIFELYIKNVQIS